jgi:hypothetical protein
MITFQDLIDSQLFFTVFIKNDAFFNSLKENFPEILADLTSSRDNPNCSCKNRVKAYLQPRITINSKYFKDLLNIDGVKKIIEEKAEEIKNTKLKDPMEEHMRAMQEGMFKNSGGNIFEIGKSEEDWKNLCKKLETDKILFKNFSILEKEDRLVVYFI